MGSFLYFGTLNAVFYKIASVGFCWCGIHPEKGLILAHKTCLLFKIYSSILYVSTS